MKKGIIYTYIILFCVFVIAPIPVFWLIRGHIDTSNLENRTLAEKPVLSISTIGDYPEKFEAYFTDHLPFRNQLVLMGGIFDYEVFHSTTSKNVMIGKDGWLFYVGHQSGEEDPMADYYGTNLMSEEQLQTAAANLIAARDRMEERGGEFLVVISPSKMTACKEYVPDRYGKMADYKRMQQVVEYLRANTDLRIVWTYESVSAYHEAHPDTQLFYKFDTHWNNLGSYVAASQVLEEGFGFDPFPPLETQDIFLTETQPFDLSRMLMLGSYLNEKDDVYTINPNGYTTHFITQEMNEDLTLLHYTVPDQTADPRKVLMVSDSFGTGIAPFIAQAFNELNFNFYYHYDPAVLEREAPDVLIYEVTERYLEHLWGFHVDAPYGQ